MFKPLQVIKQKSEPGVIHEDYEESQQVTPRSQKFAGCEGNNSFWIELLERSWIVDCKCVMHVFTGVGMNLFNVYAWMKEEQEPFPKIVEWTIFRITIVCETLN